MNENKIYKDGFPFVHYEHPRFGINEMTARSIQFYEWMNQRRTVRDFSDEPVPQEVMENIILAASTAPSGAHKQPWTFCLVKDADFKKQIRMAAETEEKESYDNRMSDEWLIDLLPLGTDWQKPFLETAPWLIVVFKRIFEYDEHQTKRNNYYVSESVGIACGMLLTAIHHAGLVALTHTPSPMNFLTSLLNRPDNERPFLLIPVGYAADETFVPDIKRKDMEEIISIY